jgi:hypothetical protein
MSDVSPAAELLSAALRYAELGYRVFPCIPNTKKPITANGFHDAVTDAVQIERWWSRHPNANIGIPTEGLLVVDIDGVGNPWPGDPERAADLAGAGAVALTPRGGRHYLFRQAAGKHWRCTEGRLAPKVDTRADGGYIVVAPSKTEDGAYTWAPGLELDGPPERLPEPPSWLASLLDALASVPGPTCTTTGPGTSHVIPEGQRNATLARLAGAMRRVGMGLPEIAAALHQTNRGRCQPPLADREVERIAASIARYEPDQIATAMAEGHWDQLMRAQTPQLAPVSLPFPLDALPDPIRGFVDAGARAIGCDVSYLALPLLTVIAAAIGNTRRLELKRGWCVPPILWGAIVGESGTAKTPAFRLVMRPVRERQRKALERHAEDMKQYKADLACWERDMAAWKKKGSGLPPAEPEEPQAERFIVSDTTVEALAPILLDNPRGLLLARDELAGWIGSFDRYAGKSKAGADSANWLSMFNAESIIVDRKTGIPRTIHVPQAAVCVVGGIQPAILQRALGLEHRESGLAARLLLAYPPRKAKRWTEADIDPDAEAELVRLFDRLYGLQPTTDDDGEPRPVLVRLSGDAQAAWIAYYNAHAVEQTDLAGDMAAAWSKLEEYAARLALVIHFIRWAAGDVANETRLDAASMKAGIVLAKWFKHEARRVYAMLDETDTERDQRRLIEWIDRKGGTVAPREAQQGCRWLKKPGAAELALEELVKAGHGNWEQSPPGQRGQPTRRFKLSTVSTVYGNSVSLGENNNTVDVDAVDAEEVKSPMPTSTVSTVYGNSEFLGGNSNTVDVDSVDAGETATPASDGRSGLFGDYDLAGPDCKGGRLFPDIPRLPD